LVDWLGCPVLGQVVETLFGRRRGRGSAGFALSFPWEAEVVDEVSGEVELGVGGEDEPGPAVGLFGGAQRGGPPAEGVLEELRRCVRCRSGAGSPASRCRG